MTFRKKLAQCTQPNGTPRVQAWVQDGNRTSTRGVIDTIFGSCFKSKKKFPSSPPVPSPSPAPNLELKGHVSGHSADDDQISVLDLGVTRSNRKSYKDIGNFVPHANPCNKKGSSSYGRKLVQYLKSNSSSGNSTMSKQLHPKSKSHNLEYAQSVTKISTSKLEVPSSNTNSGMKISFSKIAKFMQKRKRNKTKIEPYHTNSSSANKTQMVKDDTCPKCVFSKKMPKLRVVKVKPANMKDDCSLSNLISIKGKQQRNMLSQLSVPKAEAAPSAPGEPSNVDNSLPAINEVDQEKLHGTPTFSKLSSRDAKQERRVLNAYVNRKRLLGCPTISALSSRNHKSARGLWNPSNSSAAFNKVDRAVLLKTITASSREEFNWNEVLKELADNSELELDGISHAKYSKIAALSPLESERSSQEMGEPEPSIKSDASIEELWMSAIGGVESLMYHLSSSSSSSSSL